MKTYNQSELRNFALSNAQTSRQFVHVKDGHSSKSLAHDWMGDPNDLKGNNNYKYSRRN